ncbi:MAG: 2-C-methyl-D-erythritol 4-phosphate cytidylyltransferase [Candidatus Omnitrophica bacterium]|nr:2-C-methyl-D-erythritol 4-phosphate cytidylyltransferase [Candidatus Omnitrophota bacterium]
MKVALIVPAAGRGRRLGSKKPKPFVPVLGRPLLAHTLERLSRSFSFSEMIVAVDAARLKNAARLAKRFRLSRKIKFVSGGRTRARSVQNALLAVSEKSDWVLVHDAARPLVSRRLVRRLLSAAKETGAAIAALPATATVKQSDVRRRRIVKTLDRDVIFLAQTPQVFRKNLLAARARSWGKAGGGFTDEARLFEGSAVRVRIVEGDPRNIKVTTKEDMELFKFYARRHRL